MMAWAIGHNVHYGNNNTGILKWTWIPGDVDMGMIWRRPVVREFITAAMTWAQFGHIQGAVTQKTPVNAVNAEKS